ncbi:MULTISPECIES: hypothetical protein [unclassified Luteococcus]|uniref:hypothetical protein n=1 Tax=unclassified Luteococcus TaxID=2639923 RepID=UPI00313DBA33
MHEISTLQNRPMAHRLAVGGTALTAVIFLVVGAGSLLANHGVFSAGIAAMLVLYAALLAFLAQASHRGSGLATGGMMASAVLHVLVGVSTARGSHQWWIWLFVLLALVTAVCAAKVHLDELKAAD